MLQAIPTSEVWLPMLWYGAWLRAEESVSLWNSKAGTSKSSPAPPHPETASWAMMWDRYCSTKPADHGHSAEAKLEDPEGEAGTEVSTPSPRQRPLMRLMLLSSLLCGIPWHLTAGYRQGPQASLSCMSSSGCVCRTSEQLQAGDVSVLWTINIPADGTGG